MLNRATDRVLIVDDDRAIHRVVARMLAGFELCSAYDGPSALAEVQAALAQRAEFALAVLDVDMPGWGGLDTLEQIWRIAPDLQALFCTGTPLDHHDLRARFGDTDAILVIKKPFSQVELAQAVHALTTKWRLQRQARSQVDHLEAAVAARTAQLAAANQRLAGELAWRDRVETDLRVSQRLEAVGQLAAGIAHEINNPLQYVGDHLEFVHEATADLLGLIDRIEAWSAAPGPAGAPAQFGLDAVDLPFMRRELPEALDAIHGGIQRIRSIVRAMKDLSHPGMREARAADINRAIESALEISASSYRTFADVDKRLSPLPQVTCFIVELGQVFLNLIVNAAHAMEARGEGHGRGTLTVTSALDGDSVVISVSDTGDGIPPEIQQRIFDPFFTTKEVGRGTGQGLAIARAIVVDRHGGSLSFDSVPARGTTFTIRLPVAGPRPRPAPAAA
ncbi:MAG TPA: ATP-binding protein [Kofleriaceae bacterium]|nr:ATP-binding protein [Kofleriaceae bacterium]